MKVQTLRRTNTTKDNTQLKAATKTALNSSSPLQLRVHKTTILPALPENRTGPKDIINTKVQQMFKYPAVVPASIQRDQALPIKEKFVATPARSPLHSDALMPFKVNEPASRFSNTKVVQPFKEIKKDKYALDKDTTADARKPFTRFEDDMSVVDTTAGKMMELKWQKHEDALPSLNVANDQSLAINSISGEPKEFYAASEVINHSNASLKNVNSPLTLITAGNKITIPGSTKELTMIQPSIREKAAPRKDAFTKMSFDICRDVAKEIMGGSISHALLKHNDKKKAVPVLTASSTVVTGTHHLAEALATGPVNIDNAEQAMNKGGSLNPGKKYGKVSKPGGPREDNIEALGLNTAAGPSIGQAYLTQSIFDDMGSKIDYATTGEPENAFVWGYHFGAVVAESIDKSDQIILENYNRSSDIKQGQKKLLEELKKKFKAEVASLELAPEEGTNIQIGRIIELLKNTADLLKIKAETFAREAEISYSKMFNELNDSVTTHWYFRIVGQGKGESWHEQMAASGYFVNPLTMAVANLPSQSSKIYFDSGSSSLSHVGKNQVKSLATLILSSISQGQVPAKIKVTGYGNGWMNTGAGAAEKGDARADAVVTELQALNVPGGLIEKVASPGKNSKTAKENRWVKVDLVD